MMFHIFAKQITFSNVHLLEDSENGTFSKSNRKNNTEMDRHCGKGGKYAKKQTHACLYQNESSNFHQKRVLANVELLNRDKKESELANC